MSINKPVDVPSKPEPPESRMIDENDKPSDLEKPNDKHIYTIIVMYLGNIGLIITVSHFMFKFIEQGSIYAACGVFIMGLIGLHWASIKEGEK